MEVGVPSLFLDALNIVAPCARRRAVAVALTVTVLSLPACGTQRQLQQSVPTPATHIFATHHVRQVVLMGQAQPVGRLPAAQIMQLDIVLPLRDPAGLNSFLQGLYDPASPSYRHFLTLLSTDGTSTSCVDSASGDFCDDTEQTLDMTQAIGMAPELASLVMYIGSTETAIMSAMTTHSPLPTTIGCSWGWTPADATTLDPYFEKMAAQGQTFFAASGDNSTWSSSNGAWPADDANVVSVGGTDLLTASPAGPWQSETAWSESGGGISPDGIAIPAWQQLAGVINSSNQGATTLRNGPDVSANANYTFYVCADQTACTANEFGGTTFAAPMWAAYIALVNQQLVASGAGPIGFINPAIYSIGIGPTYNSAFHDITSGTSGSYSAVVGYDLVTGWGSPNGTNLINSLGSYK
jgi:subtilase family serine protease